MKLHLYAVSSAASSGMLESLPLSGIGGAPVRVIQTANLTALVSDTVSGADTVRDSDTVSDAALEARDALVHHAVIERSMVVANLLPARHAAAISLEVLTAHLTQHSAAYEGLLARIGDAREFGVRAELEKPLGVTAAPRSSGTAYLQARHAQFSAETLRRGELELIADAVESQLISVILQAKRDYPSADVYRGSFLVRGRDLELAQRIGAEAVLDLRGARGSWHGPFPPYSFAVLP